MMEKWKYVGGTVLLEQWNSGTVMVEQCWCNSDGTVKVEQWNSVGGTLIVEK